MMADSGEGAEVNIAVGVVDDNSRNVGVKEDGGFNLLTAWARVIDRGWVKVSRRYNNDAKDQDPRCSAAPLHLERLGC